MTGYIAVEAYGTHGCGRCHVVHTCHKRLVHAIEMCGILCLKVMMTFSDHLSLLLFLMNSRCTKVTAMDSFNHSSLVKIEFAIKSYSAWYVQRMHSTLHRDKGPLSTYCSERCYFAAWKESNYWLTTRASGEIVKIFSLQKFPPNSYGI